MTARPSMLVPWLRARERALGPLAAAAIPVLGILLFWGVLPARYQVNESTDFTVFYEPVARNLLAGEGLVDHNGDPAVRYPPGYPLILAGLFWLAESSKIDEGLVLRLFTLLCAVAGSVAIYLTARTASGFPAALLAPVGLTAYPFFLWLSKQPNSEMPFVAFLYSGFYLFWTAVIGREKSLLRSFSGGLSIGIAMLIRPTAIGTAVALAPLFWWWRRDLAAGRRLGLIAMLLAGNLVPVIPWQMWTIDRGIGIIPLSTAGGDALLAGLTSSVRPHDWRERIDLPGDVEELMRRLNDREMEIRKGLAGASRVVLEEGRRSPLAMVKLMLRKVARSWYATDSQRFETRIAILQFIFMSVLVLSAALARWRGRRPWMLAQAIWLTVFYFWCICSITYPLVRYMVPAIGLLFVLLPETASYAIERGKTR